MEPRSIIRWQHRLKREHPTCTERTKALIEECGWKGGDSGDSAGKKQRDQQIPKRIPLTPTGLLMEGDYTTTWGIAMLCHLECPSLVVSCQIHPTPWSGTFSGPYPSAPVSSGHLLSDPS